MKGTGRWWKVGIAGAIALLVLLLSIISLQGGGGHDGSSPWRWTLGLRDGQHAGFRCHADLASLRESGFGGGLLEAASPFASAASPILWKAISGAGDRANVNELYAGVRLQGGGYPTGQVAILLRGEFSPQWLREALVEEGLLSFSREVNGREVHRLRARSTIPPELVVIDRRHVVVCDAQSTPEVTDPAAAGSSGPEPPPGALVWAEGLVRREDVPAAFPADSDRARFTLLVTGTNGDGVRIQLRLRPSGPPDAFAGHLREQLANVPLVGRGAGFVVENSRVTVTHTDEEVLVRADLRLTGAPRSGPR
jgi:hypothetical protein